MSLFGEVINAEGQQAQEPRNIQDQRMRVAQFLQDQAEKRQQMQQGDTLFNTKMAQNAQDVSDARQQKLSEQAGSQDYLNILKNRSGGSSGNGPNVSPLGATQTPDMTPLSFDTVANSILKNKPNISPTEFSAAMKQFEPQFAMQDKMKLAQFDQQQKIQLAQARGQFNSRPVDEQIYETAIKQGKTQDEAIQAAQTYKRAGAAEAGDVAGAKAFGKEGVAIEKDINARADNATLGNVYLDHVNDLTKGFTPGKLAPLKSELSAWAQASGLMSQDEADQEFGSAGDVQALAKSVIPMVSQQVKQLSSRPTQMEWSAFLKANPNASLTPDGLNKVIGFMRKINGLDIQKQKEFQGWKKGKDAADYMDFSPFWDSKVAQDLASDRRAQPTDAPGADNTSTDVQKTLDFSSWK